MPFADVGGFRLHHRWEGAGSGPVLLLSHSLGATSEMWRPQLAALGERFRVLLYDHRGHGQSGLPEPPWSIADFGRDALALLDHLKLSQVHFCGLSLGGMVGMWLAQNAPERIGRLVLCNTSARTEDPSLLRGRIAEVERGGMEPIVENILARWFTEEFHARHSSEVDTMRRMVRAASPLAYAATSHAVCDLDLRAGLDRIAAPTLVVIGGRDRATPPEWNRSIAAAIPGSETVELEAAHLSNIEAREAFNAAVLRFLNSD